MKPILFRFTFAGSEHVIASYGLCMLIACAAAFFMVVFLAKRPPFSGRFPTDILFLIIALGLGGACMTGFILFLPAIISGQMKLTDSALVSWGGILGGIAGFLFAAKHWQIPRAAFADLLAPAYLMGLGIGRIGCFLGGCCFGVHTDSRIGLAFVDNLAPAAAALQPLVPVQLISAFYLITGASLFAVVYLRKAPASGLLFAYSALYYSAGRFIIEFWRNDARVFLFGLSDGQLFAVCFFISALLILYKGKFYGQNGTSKSDI